MKISKFIVKNFRSAAEINFVFNERLNLFVGVNGSGKSTILDGLAICLSWLIKRIERENGRGTYIPDSSLRNGQSNGFLELTVFEGERTYRWLLAKTAKGQLSEIGSRVEEVNKIAEIVKVKHTKDMSWPVIAYYPVNRTVGTIRPEVSDKDSIYNLDVYENALSGKTNYQMFFEWFRVQDDILNEKAQSRSKWMVQNRTLIKRKLNRLVLMLKKSVFHNYIDNDELRYITERFQNDEIIYQDPGYLFYELSHMIDMVKMSSGKSFDRYGKIMYDINKMCRKMDSLSREYKDDLIGSGGLHEEMIDHIVYLFENVRFSNEAEKNIVTFLWEFFSFMILISLWWLSESGRRELQHTLRVAWQPTIRDNMLIQEYTRNKIQVSLRKIIKEELVQKENAYRNGGRELQIVAKAIEQFVPEYSNLRVKRVPRPHMLIDKKGVPFNLDQLSDGEKNLIALVGDIARRLAIANPRKSKPLDGKGVVLIDEIDLHLHPKWQRLVVPKLLETFPHCQFFISTHSPLVISHVKPENVFLLEQNEYRLNYKLADETYGMSIDRVVEVVMDDESRPDHIRKDLDMLFELIERKKLIEAKNLILSLKEDLKTDPELTRAEILIRREELKR